MGDATLTLSRVERAAVHRHLEVVYGRLCNQTPRHKDCVALHRIMTRLEHDTTIALSTAECMLLVRYLRGQQGRLRTDMMALEERRIRGGVDGTLDAAHAALDTDVTLLDDVVRRLWQIL